MIKYKFKKGHDLRTCWHCEGKKEIGVYRVEVVGDSHTRTVLTRLKPTPCETCRGLGKIRRTVTHFKIAGLGKFKILKQWGIKI